MLLNNWQHMGARRQKARTSFLLTPESPDDRCPGHSGRSFFPLNCELHPVSVTGAFRVDMSSLMWSVTTIPPLIGWRGTGDGAGVGRGVPSSRTISTQTEKAGAQQPCPAAEHPRGLGRGNNPPKLWGELSASQACPSPSVSRPAPCSSRGGARSSSLPWAGHCPGCGSPGEGRSLTLPQLPSSPVPPVRSGKQSLPLSRSWRSPSCPSEGRG